MSVPFTNISELYINGQWVKPASGHYEAVQNPATEEVIGQAPVAGTEDADAAIAAAREAFDKGPWPRMSMAERIAVMGRFRDCLVAREQEVRALLQAEVGASHLLLNGPQFGGVVDIINYVMQLAGEIKPKTMEVTVTPSLIDPNASGLLGSAIVVKDPVGVVVGISAYNYPLLINMTKLAPALIVGNCLVLKPSPLTPFTALMLGKIAEEAGIPPGVLNIITGGADVGSMISADPRVDMISFTGSDAVGAAILAQSASTMKHVHLELGGKSVMIVRADADVQAAGGAAAFNFTMHAGQGCALLTRFIVHNSVRAQFVETVKATLGFLKVGDPAEPDTIVGPLISEAARAKTENFVKKGLEEGGVLIAGGKRPEHLQKGFFFEPTLFDDVDNRSTLAQCEVFGPIGVVIGFDTDEEAVAMANDSNFGLSGGIYSADKAKAFEMAKQLRTGDVKLNGGTAGLYLQAPFGGYKRSGIGREFGPNWLDAYTLEKAIHYPIG
ncbi:MAG: aldehyde dehydrogenase [Gammaproteobacteria bacterium BRH_c0]|nr:MAG: aldehyde dehydrogenase [Gammaproteobacteria bacterium BRH_c0]